MSYHDRRLRRAERPRASEDVEHPEPSARPDVADLLALQRTAGNQAVIARLMLDQATNQVKIPQSYADRKVRWDGTKQDSTAGERRVADVVAVKPGLEHFKEGLGVPHVAGVTTVADAALGLEGARTSDSSKQKGLGGRFKEAAVDHHRLLQHTSGEKTATLADATITPVMAPEDFLPEAPDLPAAGVRLDSTRKEFEQQATQQGSKKKGKNDARALPTYWEFMCVLIALLTVEGVDCEKATAAADNKKPGSMLEAVQALHDEYMRRRVPLQYDDSSARRKVMGEWGYSMHFAGRSGWKELPGRVTLAPGKYIFDIKGHTVAVDVLQAIGPKTKIDKESDFFTCHSDSKNYDKNEFLEQVHYIWKK